MGTVSSIHAGDAITAEAFILGWPHGRINLLYGDETRRCRVTDLQGHVKRLEDERSPEMTLEALGPYGCLWARVEGAEQNRQLSQLKRPTMILREGGSSRRTALWLLNMALGHTWTVKANRRIAYFTGGTQKTGDPDHARFPVPGTALREGRSRPVPIVVEWLGLDEYQPRELVGRLKDPPPPKDWREGR